MLRRSLIIFSVVFVTLFFAGNVQAFPEAKNVRYPISGDWNVTYGFLRYNSRGYHLGEDVPRKAGTPVYAIAAGLVKVSKYCTGKGNYGGLIIIEHRWPGETVCSLYGHLGKRYVSAGQTVSKGQKIALIGNWSQNGQTSEHLHFAIARGAYKSKTICGKWRYGGYASCSSHRDLFYPPRVFIEIRKAWWRNGGKSKVGYPKSASGIPPYIHQWNGYWCQDYDGGRYGWCNIMYTDRKEHAYVIRTGFWGKYRSLNGPKCKLRGPTSDEYPFGPGAKQNFEGGYLLWNGFYARSYYKNGLVMYIASPNPAPADKLLLHQNAPNPFNPETRISFSLPQAMKVSLKVYNVRGELIRTLVEGERNAGEHSVFWNGTDEQGIKVASGVYFYCLETKDLVQTKKMVLLK